MKYLIVFLLIFTNIYAQKLSLGAGSYIQSQPYKGAKNIVLPSPVIFYNDGLFYARWSRFGAYFLGKKNDDYSWGLSATIQPRTYGYKASDSSKLTGMDTRKNSLEAGLAYALKLDNFYFEVTAFTDMLNRSNAWIYEAEAGYEFNFGKFMFFPTISAIYQSSDFVNYYYGVKQSEANANRIYYNPSGGMQYEIQAYFKYAITKKISTLLNFKAAKLPSQATNSPIVDDDYIYSGLISLIYTFEY